MNEIQWLKNTTYPKISFKPATIKMKMTHVDIFYFLLSVSFPMLVLRSIMSSALGTLEV